MNFLFTIDVEVWCDGWDRLDERFAASFMRCIHGRTSRGEHGLPLQLRILSDHGIRAVCFVEPLFALRFGRSPLSEIVGLIQEAGHEVQLHLHTEWAAEAPDELFPGSRTRRQNLFDFNLEQQRVMIATGRQLLEQAGATAVNSFRAGNFGFNCLTLEALNREGFRFDSSYNASLHGLNSGVAMGDLLTEPWRYADLTEVPMTVFKAGPLGLRHAQLNAISALEFRRLIDLGLDRGRSCFVVLSHGTELLNARRDAPNHLVIERLRELCRHVESRALESRGGGADSAVLRSVGFADLCSQAVPRQPDPLECPGWLSLLRVGEQAWARAVY